MYFQANNYRIVACAILTFFSFSIFGVVAKSQILPNYGHPSPVEIDMRYRDWALDRMKRRKELTPVEQKFEYEQLNKDFKQLQVLNNDLIKLRTAGNNPDYNAIAQKALEINKISARLISRLKLPAEEEAAKKNTNPSNSDVNLTAVLNILDTVIYKFVKNPIFNDVEIIEVKDATIAKTDLDRILLLSERAKKKAESLSKGSAKN